MCGTCADGRCCEQVLKAQGKHGAALDHCNKALAIRKKVLGDAHPDVADCLINIGNVCVRHGVWERCGDA